MNPAEAREVDSSRYPPHLSEAGFMPPCPRRIRADAIRSSRRIRTGDAPHEDIAWSYAYPAAEVIRIAGLVAFYDEKVDAFLDGVPVAPSRTRFSGDDS